MAESNHPSGGVGGISEDGGGGISVSTLKSDVLTADGTEQTLYSGNVSSLEMSGRIDLDNMKTDDKVILRTHINDKMNAVSTYEDGLLQSQITIAPVLFAEEEVWKVTIEQTATGTGGYKDIPYKILGRG